MINMKIATVIGTRPQYIKYYPIHYLLNKYFEEVLIDTNQHYDENMSGIFYKELGIKRPDYNIKATDSGFGTQLGDMLRGIEDVLRCENPDAVIVFGDTNSTLAGAIVGARLGLPVFHIESGLRSFNRFMPEEQNRIVADCLSSLLFCPTQIAVNNLKAEGITDGVHCVGDVMQEATSMAYERASLSSHILDQFGLEKKQFLLLTFHRAENTGDDYQTC